MGSNTLHLGIVRTILAGMAAIWVASGTPAFAQASQPIEGIWAVTITQRDCTTGTVIGAPFRALVTFHQGGTVSESGATPAFAPGQRSIGHGNWTHLGGASFVERTALMILFDTPANPPSPGFQAGWQVVNQTITLVNANSFTSVGQSVFYDLNRQPYRVACASRVGERFR
jgi:hypothetical protein